MQAVIQAITSVATGIVQLSLMPADGAVIPVVKPGAHIDLYLPNGLVRQYSLLNHGPTDTLKVAVNLDPKSRGGSACVHRDLRPGDRIEIGLPRNNFPLVGSAPHSVFIAGGIGITPIYAMVHRLSELGQGWTLYHCARSPDRTPYMAELRSLAARGGGTLVHVHDGIAGIAPLDIPAVVAGAEPGAHFYCCGPKPLMEAFEAATAKLPAERVHVEYFANAAAQDEGYGFELICARSNLTLQIPSGTSILQALEAQGIAPLCSCREGVCGTCETTILAGEADHRDLVLCPDERASNATMMICVSRAKSASLTLDI